MCDVFRFLCIDLYSCCIFSPLVCVCVCVCYSRGLDLWGLWVNGWGWGVLQGLYSFVYRQVCLCICLFVHFCIFVFVYLCVCLTSEKMGEDMAPCTLPLRHKWRPRHCQALPPSHPPSPCVWKTSQTNYWLSTAWPCESRGPTV